MHRLCALLLLPLWTFCQDPLTVDQKHYHVDLENDLVRVLRVHYEPGEGSPMHRHGPGVRIFLTDVHNRFSYPDGSTSEATRKAGEVAWAESVTHANTMLGGSGAEMIELEIKHPLSRAAQATVPATSADKLETVVFENECVRVIRTKLLKGGRLNAHMPDHSVIVAMEAAARGIPKAVVTWSDSDAQRSLSGLSGPLDVVTIQIKRSVI